MKNDGIFFIKNTKYETITCVCDWKASSKSQAYMRGNSTSLHSRCCRHLAAVPEKFSLHFGIDNTSIRICRLNLCSADENIQCLLSPPLAHILAVKVFRPRQKSTNNHAERTITRARHKIIVKFQEDENTNFYDLLFTLLSVAIAVAQAPSLPIFPVFSVSRSPVSIISFTTDNRL